MHGSQQVGEALRRNRRRHSTNWFVCCSVEDFAECRKLLLQEKGKHYMQNQNLPESVYKGTVYTVSTWTYKQLQEQFTGQ